MGDKEKTKKKAPYGKKDRRAAERDDRASRRKAKGKTPFKTGGVPYDKHFEEKKAAREDKNSLQNRLRLRAGGSPFLAEPEDRPEERYTHSSNVARLDEERRANNAIAQRKQDERNANAHARMEPRLREILERQAIRDAEAKMNPMLTPQSVAPGVVMQQNPQGVGMGVRPQMQPQAPAPAPPPEGPPVGGDIPFLEKLFPPNREQVFTPPFPAQKLWEGGGDAQPQTSLATPASAQASMPGNVANAAQTEFLAGLNAETQSQYDNMMQGSAFGQGTNALDYQGLGGADAMRGDFHDALFGGGVNPQDGSLAEILRQHLGNTPEYREGQAELEGLATPGWDMSPLERLQAMAREQQPGIAAEVTEGYPGRYRNGEYPEGTYDATDSGVQTQGNDQLALQLANEALGDRGPALPKTSTAPNVPFPTEGQTGAGGAAGGQVEPTSLFDDMGVAIGEYVQGDTLGGYNQQLDALSKVPVLGLLYQLLFPEARSWRQLGRDVVE